MKNTSKGERFLAGKGFYIALVVCIVAILGSAWLGVNSAIDKLSENEPIPQNDSSQSEWLVPNKTVEAKKDDVPAQNSQSTVSSQPEPIESKPPEAENPQSQSQNAVIQGFILPISGEIMNPYSGDKVVKSKTLDDWVMHTGIDISAELSTPVKAMSAGTVLSITNDSLWGTTAVVDHGNGIVGYYSNLKPDLQVSEGETLKMGDIIGEVGDSCDIERAEGSHLHFAVKKNDEYVDPMSIIN